MRTFILVAIGTVLAPSFAYAGQKPLVQITSVTVSGSSSLAELTVRQGPVDLADLEITDLEGEPAALAAAAKPLATGAVVRLHWEKATAPAAGSVAVAAHVLSATDDQLELLYKGAPHDAVAWTNGDGAMAQAEAADLAAIVRDAMWKGAAQADAVTVPDGKRIDRVGAADTNTKADWKAGTGEAAPPDEGGELPGAGAADLVLLCAAGAVILRGARDALRR